MWCDVRETQVPRISEHGLKRSMASGLVDLLWHGIDEHDVVASSRQRRCVNSCRPTDVEESRSCPDVSSDQLLHAFVLQAALS
jgi:hypothetical protein